jgi:two-component system, chemotaxis family, CheB/CheR fusion protein
MAGKREKMTKRRRRSGNGATAPRPRRRAAPQPADLPDATGFPVVGIGASAGGLDAFQKFFDALPPDSGMAFILVQHLEPKHPSMMVELLAGHTAMKVQQAAEGMRIEPDRIYVIPPGVYLSISGDALHLSEPRERHGSRMPFDFLLNSMATEIGERAICVILSGTGTDGSHALKAVKEKGGLVIAQDPDEAAYDGMPRSAIATGAVDHVLPVAEIPQVLFRYDRRMAQIHTKNGPSQQDLPSDWLLKIIEHLRTNTAYDFTLYKLGTLQRRIERRMATAAFETADMDRYLEFLRSDPVERDLLAKDLLINVTSFFRDTKVFDLLAATIIPDLIRSHPLDQPLRIWVAGCSTGEETYSLAMLFREQITLAERSIKLQVLASDIDPDAVAQAREGLYPETIEADVTPARLARFFTKEYHGYRVSSEIRAAVVFTVQDVLTDPPFSRLDLVSCRNLLIYLRPEAQTKVLALFDFALRDGGILLLGNTETIGNLDGRFEVISKPERLYRHIGHGRPEYVRIAAAPTEGAYAPRRQDPGLASSRPGALADLCRRLVMEDYAPAAVLVNRKYECLFSLGPIDRYLRVAPGLPAYDVLAMARDDVRTKLRSAVQRAFKENTRIAVAGGRINRDGKELSFSIAVQPASSEGEDLMLICFIDEPAPEVKGGRPTLPEDASRVAELEQELDATTTELQDAIRSLEKSSDEQQSINEEALSINEEYQATNEELLASKEELQSLNEELTSLNSQLHETLEQQRTTSNDLQNILYSTNVATLFLDTSLNIRFFTPATKLLFNIIPGDVGRPIADLNSLAADEALATDALTVQRTLAPIEREIEARNGAWYVRRVMPYRTLEGGVEGVVITFVDITEKRLATEALEAAKRQAQLANVAKSRFLAAASHDLRQPLQTLALLQGLLAKTLKGEKAQKLITRFDETLSAMSAMLNALLDINEIEAGTVRAEMVTFPLNDLFDRLREEFGYRAHSQRLELHVVPCGLSIHSDPVLLEQVIRNLLANALKYTDRGKVLLGCRRREGKLSIEIWDTGIGIPNEELDAIFEEYHQVGNAARERSRGLGLGLSIVKRLGILLDHRVSVRSRLGKGSVFAIEVTLPASAAAPQRKNPRQRRGRPAFEEIHRTGTILVVEDDPEVRDLLELLLQDEGHRPEAAPDGATALKLAERKTFRPDVILADYNLPNGMNGLDIAAKLRERLQRQIPVIILTGDISTGTLRDISLQNCIQLNKPVKLKELTQTIQRLLPPEQEGPPLREAPPLQAAPPLDVASDPAAPVIFVVDDDNHLCEALRSVLEDDGRTVEDYGSCEAFLEAYLPGGDACLLVDAYLPGMSGLQLLQRLRTAGDRLPAIMITGFGDVPMAVQAMKAGASDFIEKPINRTELLASVKQALEQSRDLNKLMAWREDAAKHVAGLSRRQRQVMDMILAGHPNKNIAADLGISQRTVENHRALIMKKTGSKSLPALARLALAAAEYGTSEPPLPGDLRPQPPSE